MPDELTEYDQAENNGIFQTEAALHFLHIFLIITLAAVTAINLLIMVFCQMNMGRKVLHLWCGLNNKSYKELFLNSKWWFVKHHFTET